jgi:tRNA A-37 threonylcarbamoyl transferase component Bud32
LKQSYPDKVDSKTAERLAAEAKRGELPQPKTVSFVDAETLKNNRGAYSADDGGTVYLDRRLMNDPRALDRVYAEEAGHHLDAHIKGQDSPGDEGEMFARGLEKRGPVDKTTEAELRKDRDHDEIAVNGKNFAVEFDGTRGRLPAGPGAPGPGGPNGSGGAPGPGGPNGSGGAPGPGGPNGSAGAPGPGGPNGQWPGGQGPNGHGGLPPPKAPITAAGRDIKLGGFADGKGWGRMTPEPHEIRDATVFMKDEIDRAREQLQNSKNNPQAYGDAYKKLRDLELGAARLQDVASVHGMQFSQQLSTTAGQLRGNAEAVVLDGFTDYVKSMEAGGQKPSSQDDVEQLAKLAAWRNNAPIDARGGAPDMAAKMWERLNADAKLPGNEALKKRLEGVAAAEGQNMAAAKKAHQAALFEDDPAKRKMYVDALEKNGSLMWKSQVDELRAAELAFGYRAGKQDVASYETLKKGWEDLGAGGNDFARMALGRLSPDLQKDLASTDERTRLMAQTRVLRATQTFQDNRNNDRIDHLTHGLNTGSSYDELKTARERLQKEVAGKNEEAKPVLDRVWTQEHLTQLKSDPKVAAAELAKRSGEGNKIARDALRIAMETPDKPERAPKGTYEPFELGRNGKGVQMPRLTAEQLETVKLEGAKTFATGASREEARAMADVYTRWDASPQVQYEVGQSLRQNLAAKNQHTLSGMTDVLSERTPEGHARLGRMFVEGKDLKTFEYETARLGRAATQGSERAIDALSNVVPLGSKVAEQSLVGLAKTGKADRVTEALLEVPEKERGEKANYYRALGESAAARTKPKYGDTDKVFEVLRSGLVLGPGQQDRHPESSHHGSAQGLAAMADKWSPREAHSMANNLSPAVLDALETASDKLKPNAAEALKRSLTMDMNANHRKMEDRLRSAEAMGRIGKHADEHEVRNIVDTFGKVPNNDKAFGSVVNILSRTDDPRVKQAAVDGLFSEKAKWSRLDNVDQATRKRLVDYVSGAGDPVLSADVGKLIYDLNIRPPVAGLWHQWGVGGDLKTKATSARSFYGDEAARKLNGRVELWNRLTPDLRQKALGLGGDLSDADRARLTARMDTKLAADLMAKGTLHQSPASFLLGDLEGKVGVMAKDQAEAYRQATHDAAVANGERAKHLDAMTKTTATGVGFLDEVGHVFEVVNPANLVRERSETNRERYIKEQDKDVAKLNELDEKVRERALAVSGAAKDKLFLDSSAAAYERDRQLSEGRVKEADTIALEQWQEHGDSLRQLNPKMYDALHEEGKGAKKEGAWQRLQRNGLVKTDRAPSYDPGDADKRFNQASEVLSGRRDGLERDAVVRQALSVMDSDPSLIELTKTASLISRDLPTVQRMMKAGMDGTKFDAYVDDVQNRAVPMREALTKLRDDKALLGKVDERIDQLRALEGRMTDADAKKQIADRIKSLEGMKGLATNDGLLNVLDTVTDKSKFRADTWSNWFKHEGPKALAAIGVGVAAAAFTVATFGAGAPLAVIAAAGALGGIVGYEAMSEGLHAIHNNFDADVTSGRLKYSDRSKLGAYQGGDKIFDAETGKYRERRAWDDVIVPYAQQFATDFAITYATLGAGRFLGGQLSQGANALTAKIFGRNTEAITKMAARYGQVEAVLGKEGANKTLQGIMRDTARGFAKELPEEIGEEVAENMLQKSLEAVDPRLGMASGVLLATGKGIKLNTGDGGFKYDGKQADAVKKALEVDGYQVHVDPKQPGVMRVETPDGPVYWRANDGSAPADADWKTLSEGPAVQPGTDLPAKFEQDPNILRERAQAIRQQGGADADAEAKQLEADAKYFESPEAKQAKDAGDRFNTLKTRLDRLDRGQSSPDQPRGSKSMTGDADLDPAARQKLRDNTVRELIEAEKAAFEKVGGNPLDRENVSLQKMRDMRARADQAGLGELYTKRAQARLDDEVRRINEAPAEQRGELEREITRTAKKFGLEKEVAAAMKARKEAAPPPPQKKVHQATPQELEAARTRADKPDTYFGQKTDPKDIKGAQPWPPGSKHAPGHAEAGHAVNVEQQAEILNNPDRVFTGVNDNGRPVDIYWKGDNVVITPAGSRNEVITAYGVFSERNHNQAVNELRAKMKAEKKTPREIEQAIAKMEHVPGDPAKVSKWEGAPGYVEVKKGGNPPQNLRLEDAKIKERLGKGANKNAYVLEDGRVLVVKQADDPKDPLSKGPRNDALAKESAQGIEDEVAHIQKMRGIDFEGRPIAPRIYDIVRDKEGRAIGYTMDRVPGKELLELAQQGKLTEAQFAEVTRQVEAQAKALHDRGQIHGDPNKSNILVDVDKDGKVSARLLDFVPKSEIYGVDEDRELFQNTLKTAAELRKPETVRAYFDEQHKQAVEKAEKDFIFAEREKGEQLRDGVRELRRALPDDPAAQELLLDLQKTLGMGGKENRLWDAGDLKTAQTKMNALEAAKKIEGLGGADAPKVIQEMRAKVAAELRRTNEAWANGPHLPYSPDTTQFPRTPAEFVKWAEGLKTLDAKNVFDADEAKRLYDRMRADMDKAAAGGDPIAKGSIPHMDEHRALLAKYEAELKEMGLDPAYMNVLINAHDMGKFVPDADVLAAARGDFVNGRVAWHDQSTMAYLAKVGDELGIPETKMRHLMADIMGHNDGSGLKDVFWNKVAWPNGDYPLPRRPEGDALAFFDRVGQGSKTGAEKIARQLASQGKPFGKAMIEEAYATNPNNTVRQLEAIADRIVERGQGTFRETDMYKDAVALQKQTADAYARVGWDGDTAILTDGNGKEIARAKTVDQFMDPRFQALLWGRLGPQALLPRRPNQRGFALVDPRGLAVA